MTKAKIRVDPDGTVSLPPIAIPLSSFLSPEAKAGLIDYFRFLATSASKVFSNTSGADIVARQRIELDDHFAPALKRTKILYPVRVTAATIAGVYADVFEPFDQIAKKNENRVLVNLHGGGFVIGTRTVGALESIPVASLGKIKVLSLDYRQGPENWHPAATDDVVAVYRELLKSFNPRDIGIYGTSAGGFLAAQAIARFDKEKLPTPGAIGILAASAGGWMDGDSAYLGSALVGYELTRPENLKHPWVSDAAYFRDADFNDPLVMPIRSAAVMAKFPPTLIVSSSRDSALSAAIFTHSELIRLGIKAYLHVWEGMPHAFHTFGTDFPETKDVLNVVVKFFDTYLGTSRQPESD